MRVALVVMPFAAAHRPSLAIGLLQASLRRSGIRCDAKYFNLTFSQLLGHDAFLGLCRNSTVPLAGEWIFSQVFYGQDFSTWDSYEREVLEDAVWGVPRENRDAIRAALELAPSFLRLVFESSAWDRYDLVGFTSTFAQTTASLCLARMIRQHHRHVKIVFGGANFEGDMGRPYIEQYDFIDFISTGEADTSFRTLCERLRDVANGVSQCLEMPPGFLHNPRFEAVAARARARPVDLDELPTPDFGDYYRAASNVLATNGDSFQLGRMPVETSRGCWWGQKAHCTFCGLNGQTMAFRQKSWRRVVEEIDELGERHGKIPLQFADNILSMSYFKDLLPFWAQQPNPTPKFFEIKANLRRDQVRLLRRAGIVHVQPGIESFLDATLREMRKGTTGIQNVAFLRWCAEEGISPSWNVLYGFPRENVEDCERQLGLLRKIVHFAPPRGTGPIRLDRFSPNYTQWRELGFTAISPCAVYRHIFPFPAEVLAELAYYFDYEHAQKEAALAAGVAIESWVGRWQELSARGRAGELAVRPHWQGGFVLVDSRHGFPHRAERLATAELALLVACDAPVSRDTALERVAQGTSREATDHDGLREALERLLERSVMVETSSRILTLAFLPHQQLLAADEGWARAAGRLRRADENLQDP